MAFVVANGLRMRVSVAGEGETLTLIHGVGGRLEDWGGVADRLQRRFRIIRYDLRGHGESEKASAPYGLGDLVQDLACLLDELGISSCHLAGFSLGGMIAQGFALAHARRLKSLALLSTVAGRTDEEKERVLRRLAVVATGLPGEHFANSVDRWFTDEFRAAHPQAVAAHAKRNSSNDPEGYAAGYRILAMNDLAARLTEIKVPTIVATGENDIGSNTRMARQIHESIAASRLRIFARLRHSILIEAPEAVAELLESFITSLKSVRQQGRPE